MGMPTCGTVEIAATHMWHGVIARRTRVVAQRLATVCNKMHRPLVQPDDPAARVASIASGKTMDLGNYAT
jgi:hypothetical protein